MVGLFLTMNSVHVFFIVVITQRAKDYSFVEFILL